MKTPGERLRYARELAGHKTASAAARAMGVPVGTYVGHENNSRGLARALARYAAFFQVNLTWLMTGQGQARSEALQARIMALSSDGQKTIRQMIEFLEEREGRRRN